jgi:hypothetical protein
MTSVHAGSPAQAGRPGARTDSCGGRGRVLKWVVERIQDDVAARRREQLTDLDARLG